MNLLREIEKPRMDTNKHEWKGDALLSVLGASQVVRVFAAPGGKPAPGRAAAHPYRAHRH
jgi:hypothetical protein